MGKDSLNSDLEVRQIFIVIALINIIESKD